MEEQVAMAVSIAGFCHFSVHVSFVVSHFKGDFTPFARATATPFLAGGAFIVFVCALGGNWVMRKWTPAGRSLAAKPINP